MCHIVKSAIFVVFSLTWSVVLPVYAAEVPPPPAWESAPVDHAGLNLTVPESPAFAALGLTPQDVTHPSSPKELATELLNGMDPQGNLQTGLALDTVPYLLAYGNSLTLKQYNDNYGAQLLARTQLSVATTKGATSDDKAIRMATGLRITPWDKGDPRLDKELMKCFRKTSIHDTPEGKKLAQEIDELTIQAANEERPEVKAQLEQQVKAKTEQLDKESDEPTDLCRQQAEARHWNATAWSLGVAPTWISSTGQTSDLKWNTASVWSSLSYGFDGIPGLDEGSQILGGVRYNNGEMVSDPQNSGAFIKEDSLTTGLQLRLSIHRPDPHAAPTFILGGEGDYIYSDPEGRHITNTYRISFAGELKVPALESTYLKVTVGGGGGGSGSNQQGFVLTSLNFGLL